MVTLNVHNTRLSKRKESEEERVIRLLMSNPTLTEDEARRELGLSPLSEKEDTTNRPVLSSRSSY